MTGACTGQDAAAELPRGKATFRALYSEDGIHPSGAGTYLEACVVASAITGALGGLRTCIATLSCRCLLRAYIACEHSQVRCLDASYIAC